MNLKLFIKISISIALMTYLLYQVDLEAMLVSFKDVNLSFLAFIYFTIILGIILSTYKWMLLLRAQNINKPGFLRLWALYHIGGFFNNFLPTNVGGDLIRSYIVGKQNNKQAESLAAVAVERMSGFLALIIYGIAGIFINWDLAVQLNLIYIICGALFLICTSISLFFNRSLAKWIKGHLNWGPVEQIFQKLSTLYESFYLYKKNMPLLLIAMAISFIFQLYTIWFTFAILKTMNIQLPFTTLMLIVPVTTIIGVIPITINSIGLREGAFVFLFSYLGIPASQSLLMALLSRVGILLPSLAGGIIYAFDIPDQKNNCSN